MMPIINASPRAILRGVNDLSGRPPVYEPEALPQHLPHVFGFTERGTGVPQITIGDGLNKIYGAKSFDLRGEYATHQTLLATVLSQHANQMLFQRLIPNDAKVARFRLSLDVLDDSAGIYLRDVDGALQYDINGDPIYIGFSARGNYDAHLNLFPATGGSGTAGAIVAGDTWTINVPGTLGGTAVINGTKVRALTNAPGQTAANWVFSDADVAIKSLAWVLTEITEDIGGNTTFGAGTVDLTGPRTNGIDTSVTYPIFDFEVASAGKWGNGAGIRFSAPNINSAIPFDTRLVAEQLTTMFRMQIVERADINATPSIVETRFGEQYIDFSLKPNVVNERTSQEIYLPHIFDASYKDSTTTPPTFGTFSDVHVYQANIDTVLGDLYDNERAILATELGWTTTEINDLIPLTGKYTINFFTAVAWNGYAYESIRMASSTDLATISGTELKSTNTQFALGGDDGTITAANFDTLVAEQCADYGGFIVKRNPNGDADPSDVPLDFADTAKWPQSVIWDTGFKMATKLKLLMPMGARPDMWVALSTQEIGDGAVQNTASQESSIAITLQNAARMYPESEYYGTKTCRAIVVGHSGELTSSTWRGLAPMTIDLAAKVADYMGASNGQWKAGANFDISPKNQVSIFKADTVNATFKNTTVRNEDWANGLIWVQHYDRRSLFYPGIQTVYDDDTSVLNSLFNVTAVCELEKVCERVWRDLTGIQTLTVGQFIERSNDLITKKTAGRFDDKFIIVPETYLTEGDEQRGYSWSCKINLYAANMRTVGTYTIVSRRIEDYQS